MLASLCRGYVLPVFPPAFTLADFPSWWISVRCACGRAADLPVQLLAKRHGADARPELLAARMRCQGCGARAAEADLVDRPQREARGFVGGGVAERIPLRRP
jgi:hypothetical protein